MRSRRAWLLASTALVVLGCFFLYLAVLLRFIDCHAEANSPCSASSRYQIYASIAGLAAGLLMLVESLRARGKPLPWLLLATVAYAVWGYFAYGIVEG